MVESKNYLIQAQTSINSLLNNVSKKINLFVICDNHETGNYIEQYFYKHKLVNFIKTFSFNSQEINFPKLEGAHVTEATYYRIFISEILPKEIKTITYLDADIICLNDPLEYLNNLSRDLIEKEIGIAASSSGQTDRGRATASKCSGDARADTRLWPPGYAYQQKQFGNSVERSR